MADKYRVLSVKTPVSHPSSANYVDTFTDWTELELYPYLGPTMAAIGGFDASFKILISPKTYTELKPAKGDIIEMNLEMSVRQAPEQYIMSISVNGRPMQTTIEDMIVQLKRLNNNLEKRDV